MYKKFNISDQEKANKIKMDKEAVKKLEDYARENLRCIVCNRQIPKGDKFRIYATPNSDGEHLDVMIACFPCFGYEADGKTKRKNRVVVPVDGLKL